MRAKVLRKATIILPKAFRAMVSMMTKGCSATEVFLILTT